MPIWKLTPKEKESDRWRASRYTGYAIIRADNEDEARSIAILEFSKPPKRKSAGGETVHSPWLAPHLVKCERLLNSKL